jgi:Glycosyl hydrolase-like 10
MVMLRAGIGLVVLLVAMGPGLRAFAAEAKELGLVINEDNSHFYASRKPDDLTVAGLHAFVDQYADTTVSHLFLCPNAMRASYKSAVWDAIWELGDQEMPGGTGKAWMDNARILHERGLDPYAVWIDRCREKGISPWLTMRMNDIHDVPNVKSFMHSTFWVNHPEYWRVPHDASGGWTSRAFDYANPEVREHHMAFVRELLERYDPDGLELDWMRFGYHFKPGQEKEGCAILTQFMRDARALTKEWSEKRGHPIRLGARVPATPDAAKGLGMDGVTWVREGLVDMLVPTPFWTTSDFDIPIEQWRERIGPAAANVVLAAGLEHNLRASPGGGAVPNDLASVRGFAAAERHRGADQIYLFNFMDSQTIPVTQDEYRTLIEDGLDMKTVTSLPRRHVQCFHDTVPPGVPNGAVLPAMGHAGATFHLYTGPAPEKGTVVFLAGLAGRDGVATATFTATINGETCTAASDHSEPGKFPGAARAIQFDCPLSALKEGYNEVRVEQAADQPEQQILWAELSIDPAE